MVRIFFLLLHYLNIYFINRRTNFTGRANDTVRTFGTWSYLGCLPIRFIDHSSLYGRTEISLYDITVGIQDPSVFIPRRECLTEQEYAMRDALFGSTPKKIIK